MRGGRRMHEERFPPSATPWVISRTRVKAPYSDDGLPETRVPSWQQVRPDWYDFCLFLGEDPAHRVHDICDYFGRLKYQIAGETSLKHYFPSEGGRGTRDPTCYSQHEP